MINKLFKVCGGTTRPAPSRPSLSVKSENVVQIVQKSDDQKSSKEERVRGKTTEGLQEQRVKVDKKSLFLKSDR